jgi:hypothetical protein
MFLNCWARDSLSALEEDMNNLPNSRDTIPIKPIAN